MGNLFARMNEYRVRLKNLSDVFEGRMPRVMLVGLDGAGKTTLLYSSKLDETIYAIPPPKGINIEYLRPKRGARLCLYDMPGSKMARHYWHNWFKGTEALVYIVDSTDRVRVDESKFELHDLLQSRHLRKVPLIVVANKQDLDGAMGTEVLTAELDLTAVTDRDWSIHAVSSEKKTGIKRMFLDVVDKIRAYRHCQMSLTTPSNIKDTRKNSKSSESSGNKSDVSSDPHFTSIEDPDASNESTTKIPSLFENVRNADKVTDLDAESDVIPGPSFTPDQPEYDRPRLNTDNQSTSGESETNTQGFSYNRTLNSLSDTKPVTDTDSAELAVNMKDAHHIKEDNEVETKASVHSSNTDSVSVSSSDDDSLEEVREIGKVKHKDESFVGSENDCVKHLEQLVREEELCKSEEE